MAETKKNKRLAIVRVRGKVHLRKRIKDSLKLLNLTRINHCVVVDSRKEYLKMIEKVKDYVTWGEISSRVMEKLIQERGLLKGDKKVTDAHLKKETSFKSVNDFVKKFMNFSAEIKNIKDMKPVFRLNPPKKGYERRGIKQPYSKGGALGYRGEEISKLLEKML